MSTEIKTNGVAPEQNQKSSAPTNEPSQEATSSLNQLSALKLPTDKSLAAEPQQSLEVQLKELSSAIAKNQTIATDKSLAVALDCQKKISQLLSTVPTEQKERYIALCKASREEAHKQFAEEIKNNPGAKQPWYSPLVGLGEAVVFTAAAADSYSQLSMAKKWFAGVQAGVSALKEGEGVINTAKAMVKGTIDKQNELLDKSAETINSVRKFTNEHLGGSSLGSDRDFASTSDLGLLATSVGTAAQVALMPGSIAGATIQTGVGAIDSAYDSTIREQLVKHLGEGHAVVTTGDVAVEGAKLGVAAYAVVKGQGVSGFKTQAASITRSAAVSTAMGSTTAFATELYESADPNGASLDLTKVTSILKEEGISGTFKAAATLKSEVTNAISFENFDLKRFAMNTLEGTTGSMAFMGGLAVTGRAMATAEVNRAIKNGTAIEAAVKKASHSAAKLSGAADLADASGSIKDTVEMAENAENFQQALATTIQGGVNLADSRDVIMGGGVGRVSKDNFAQPPTIPLITQNQDPNTPGLAVLQSVGLEFAHTWDMQNRADRSEEWFIGGNVNEEAVRGFNEALEIGGSKIQAHGMSKVGTLSEGVRVLLNMIDKGLDPQRGGGVLDTAPLVNNAGEGLVGATASGSAYRDGPFILLARPDEKLDKDLSGLTAILVNEAHAEIVPALQNVISQIRPDLIVAPFSQAAEVVRKIKTQKEEKKESVAESIQLRDKISTTKPKPLLDGREIQAIIPKTEIEPRTGFIKEVNSYLVELQQANLITTKDQANTAVLIWKLENGERYGLATSATDVAHLSAERERLSDGLKTFREQQELERNRTINPEAKEIYQRIVRSENASTMLARVLQKIAEKQNTASRDDAYLSLARSLSRNNDIQTALTVVEQIERPEKQIHALAIISTELVKAGNNHQAAEVLQLALSKESQATQNYGPVDLDKARSEIITSLAKQGRTTEALSVLERFTELDSKIAALNQIAIAQAAAGNQTDAAQNFNLALDLLSQVSIYSNSDLILASIANAQSEAGFFTEARKTIMGLGQSEFIFEAFNSLVQQQVKSGDIAGADETMALVSKMAKARLPHDNPISRDNASTEIVEAFAYTNDFKQAINIASKLEDPSFRAIAYSKIAILQFQNGDNIGAQASITEAINSNDLVGNTEYHKIGTVLTVARAAAKVGDITTSLDLLLSDPTRLNDSHSLLLTAYDVTKAHSLAHGDQASTPIDLTTIQTTLADYGDSQAYYNHGHNHPEVVSDPQFIDSLERSQRIAVLLGAAEKLQKSDPDTSKLYTIEATNLAGKSSDYLDRRALANSMAWGSYETVSNLLLNQLARPELDTSTQLRYLKTLIEIRNPKGMALATKLFADTSLEPLHRLYLAEKLISVGYWDKRLEGYLAQSIARIGANEADKILCGLINQLGLTPDLDSYQALEIQRTPPSSIASRFFPNFYRSKPADSIQITGETVEDRIAELKSFATRLEDMQREELLSLLAEDQNAAKAYYLLNGGKYQYTLVNNYPFDNFRTIIDNINNLNISESKMEEFRDSLEKTGKSATEIDVILQQMRRGEPAITAGDSVVTFLTNAEFGSQREANLNRLNSGIWTEELSSILLLGAKQESAANIAEAKELLQQNRPVIESDKKVAALLGQLKVNEKQDERTLDQLATTLRKELLDNARKRRETETQLATLQNMPTEQLIPHFIQTKYPNVANQGAFSEWKSHLAEVITALQTSSSSQSRPSQNLEIELSFLDKGKDFIRSVRFADGQQCCFNSANFQRDDAISAARWIAQLNKDPLSFIIDIKQAGTNTISGFVFGRMATSPETGKPVIMLNGIYSQFKGETFSNNILQIIEERFARNIGAESIVIASVHGGTLTAHPSGYSKVERFPLNAIRAFDQTEVYDDIGTISNGHFLFNGYKKDLDYQEKVEAISDVSREGESREIHLSDLNISLSQNDKETFKELTDLISTRIEYLRETGQQSEAQRLENAEIRVAGGWVRDLILGKPSDDIDIAISGMTGAEFAAALGVEGQTIKANPDQSKHLETVKIKLNEQMIDLVNLRSESYSSESRIPEMKLGTPQEDAMRRDLTINALFYNIRSGFIEDYVGGLTDLQSMVLRTPLDPRQTLLDDPLRAIRALRFNSRYEGSTVDHSLVKAMKDPEVRSALRNKVSSERIGTELLKMMAGTQPEAGVQLLLTTGMYLDIFKNLQDLNLLPITSSQIETPLSLNLFDHTVEMVRNINKLSQENRQITTEERSMLNLAALFHDFGRMDPKFSQNNPEQIQDSGYEVRSEELADAAMKLVGIGEAERKYVTRVIKLHLKSHTDQWTDKTIAKFIRSAQIKGQDNPQLWERILTFGIADTMASGAATEADIAHKQKQISQFHDLLSTRSIEIISKPLLDGKTIMKMIPEIPANTGFISEVNNYLLDLQASGEVSSIDDAKEAVVRWKLENGARFGLENVSLDEKIDLDEIKQLKNTISTMLSDFFEGRSSLPSDSYEGRLQLYESLANIGGEISHEKKLLFFFEELVSLIDQKSSNLESLPALEVFLNQIGDSYFSASPSLISEIGLADNLKISAALAKNNSVQRHLGHSLLHGGRRLINLNSEEITSLAKELGELKTAELMDILHQLPSYLPDIKFWNRPTENFNRLLLELSKLPLPTIAKLQITAISKSIEEIQKTPIDYSMFNRPVEQPTFSFDHLIRPNESIGQIYDSIRPSDNPRKAIDVRFFGRLDVDFYQHRTISSDFVGFFDQSGRLDGYTIDLENVSAAKRIKDIEGDKALLPFALELDKQLPLLLSHLYRPTLRSQVESELNIELNNVPLRSQIHFLRYLADQNTEGFDRLRSVLQANSENATTILNAFLTNAESTTYAEAMLKIAETDNLTSEQKGSILNKYNDLASTTNKIEEELFAAYGKEATPEQIRSVTQNLLHRANEYLADYSTRVTTDTNHENIDALVSYLDMISADVTLFGSLFKNLKDEAAAGREAMPKLEELADISVEQKSSAELAAEDIEQLNRIAEKNWKYGTETNPATAEKALEMHREHLNNPDTTYFLIKRGDEIAVARRVTNQSDGSVYFGGFNVRYEAQDSGLGGAMSELMLQQFGDRKIVIDVSPNNAHLESLKKKGFVQVTQVADEDGGIAYIRLEREVH